MKLSDVDKLKKFRRITKTEKRLNFVKQRFPPPSAQLEIPGKVEDTTNIQPEDNESPPQIDNTSVQEAPEVYSIETQEKIDATAMEIDCANDYTIHTSKRSRNDKQISPSRWKANSGLAFKQLASHKKQLKVQAGFAEDVTNKFDDPIKSDQEHDVLMDYDIDTKSVAQDVHLALATGKTTIKAFAEAIGINRNYFSNLLKYPVAWNKATKLQRFAFGCVNFWLNSMKVLESNHELCTNEKNSPPSKNASRYENVTKSFHVEEVDDIIKSFDIMEDTVECDEDKSSKNGQQNSQYVMQQKFPKSHLAQNSLNKLRLSKTFKATLRKGKQGRSQFTASQVRSLSDAFDENMYPTSKERDHLANRLGLTPRQVVVYFSNHRCRKNLTRTPMGV